MLNYLKGTSAAVLSSIFIFFLISVLFDPGYGLEEVLSEFYSYLTVATMIGLICGLLGIGVLRLYPAQNLFSKDLLAIFAAAGISIGILLDLLYGLAIFPTFLLSGLLGSLMFLIVQKVDNKLISWMIVAVHFGFLFIFPNIFLFQF